MAAKDVNVSDSAVQAPTVTPRVGQAVLYVRDDYSHLEDGYASEPVLGIIRVVHEDGSVTLNAGGATVSPVSYDAGGATGTWHYAEKA